MAVELVSARADRLLNTDSVVSFQWSEFWRQTVYSGQSSAATVHSVERGLEAP